MSIWHLIEKICHKIFHYCIKCIDRWGFGMGLHGEQGVELVHSSIKKLKNQIQNSADQLKTVMMSHLTQVSPTEHPSGKTPIDILHVCLSVQYVYVCLRG